MRTWRPPPGADPLREEGKLATLASLPPGVPPRACRHCGAWRGGMARAWGQGLGFLARVGASGGRGQWGRGELATFNEGAEKRRSERPREGRSRPYKGFPLGYTRGRRRFQWWGRGTEISTVGEASLRPRRGSVSGGLGCRFFGGIRCLLFDSEGWRRILKEPGRRLKRSQTLWKARQVSGASRISRCQQTRHNPDYQGFSAKQAQPIIFIM